jgi:hypothetical protein
MCNFCCNFAADLKQRMDLTACNLVKTMLKLVPQDQTVTCGFLFAGMVKTKLIFYALFIYKRIGV